MSKKIELMDIRSNVIMQSQKNGNNYAQSIPTPMQQQHQQQQLQILINPPDSIQKNSGMDRLARRINGYRERHFECEQRFDESYNGSCQQQNIETSALQKRFLENKAKKTVKKTEKRQPDAVLTNNLHGNLHVQQQKILKRPLDGIDNTIDGFEPSHKISSTGGSAENLKFSVEIVQQLEFNSSATNAQPQLISSNVNVKPSTNSASSSDVGGSNKKSNSDIPSPHCNNEIISNKAMSTASPASHHSLDECHSLVKQEPDLDLDDLSDLPDLIDGGSTLKELIWDLNSSDFDFEEKPTLEIKSESGRKSHQHLHNQQQPMHHQFQQHHHHQYQQQHLSNPPHQQMTQAQLGSMYNGANNSKIPMCELSPAQTLKQMAEQHQHKNSMGMQFTRSPIQQNAVTHQKHVNMNRRSPNGGPANSFPNDFNKFNVDEYMNNVQFNKMMRTPAGVDNNTHIYAHRQQQQQQQQQQQEQQQRQKDQQQHYQSYMDGSSASDHNLTAAHTQPRSNTLSASQQHALRMRGNIKQFGNDEHTNSKNGAKIDGNNDGVNSGPSTALQMKQTQQMNIIQQGGNPHNIHVGQHIHLHTDMKGNMNAAAVQQALYFNQQQQNSHMNRSPSGNAGFMNDSKNCQSSPQQMSHLNTQNCTSADSIMITQMQSVDFVAAHQPLHQQVHNNQKQKHHAQTPKIKQESRNQSQLLTGNQGSFHQGAAAIRGVGAPSPNDMGPVVMNRNMNMNIQSSSGMSDSPIDTGNGNESTMSVIPNSSIKAILDQTMCLKGSSNVDVMNPNLGSRMRSNDSNIIINIDMNNQMTANPNACTDIKTNLLQQQRMLGNKTMNMTGGVTSRPPPPEYKGNAIISNHVVQQSNGGNQFNQSNASKPPQNMRHMPPNGMFYK